MRNHSFTAKTPRTPSNAKEIILVAAGLHRVDPVIALQ